MPVLSGTINEWYLDEYFLAKISYIHNKIKDNSIIPLRRALTTF